MKSVLATATSIGIAIFIETHQEIFSHTLSVAADVALGFAMFGLLYFVDIGGGKK